MTDDILLTAAERETFASTVALVFRDSALTGDVPVTIRITPKRAGIVRVVGDYVRQVEVTRRLSYAELGEVSILSVDASGTETDVTAAVFALGRRLSDDAADDVDVLQSYTQDDIDAAATAAYAEGRCAAQRIADAAYAAGRADATEAMRAFLDGQSA